MLPHAGHPTGVERSSLSTIGEWFSTFEPTRVTPHTRGTVKGIWILGLSMLSLDDTPPTGHVCHVVHITLAV